MMMKVKIRVRGTVQGVGFRPTVYRLAKNYGLVGDVCNDGEGVLIRVGGSEKSITEFMQKLRTESPPLAQINELVCQPDEGEFKFNDFVISPSINSQISTEIAADAATCPQCQQEIFDPYSRYYRYPFTNCTHCGPRLSIVRAIPYDRDHTSMGVFPMCGECAKEYQQIDNRRFHAQAIACHVCGPKAWLERSDGKPVTASMFSMLDDVDAVCTLLQRGEIVAIKGIGGFHLACDATNDTAVATLRQRKQRYDKPLALMARDRFIIEQYCDVNDREKELLESPAAPIVLLRIKAVRETEINGNKNLNRPISQLVAPRQNTLGFMLPYTPLHHLICKRMERPIVFTSGNISDEPQCIDNEVAKDKLGQIADYFLLHNRDIVNRVDDSVVRVFGQEVQILRRGRGYAPAPINLPPGFAKAPPVLAMGGELKSTFCLLTARQAILSQYLGDLANKNVFASYQDTLNLYLHLFAHHPEVIAIDKHPEYLSTKLGRELAINNQIQVVEIQHHHAHIVACMVENGLPLDTQPVLGIALDGLGYGENNTFWGGEFLLADYRQFTRLATLKPVPMIGGKQAIYQPWRNTYTQLVSAFNWEELRGKYADLEIFQFLEQKPLHVLSQMIEQNLNSPLASSTGRLFDAVAAAIGICREESRYEGQAAIEMEAVCDTNNLNNYQEIISYPFDVQILDTIDCIDPRPMWEALLNDLQVKTSPAMIAAKFHKGLADTIVKMVIHLRQQNFIKYVVLTGGVFQNKTLLQQVKTQLAAIQIQVLTHHLVPSNDGGLSLGQAAIAAARIIKS